MPFYKKLSIYVVAHQDDWQLFMNPQAARDIGDKSCRTVIIHTTAGDSGVDNGYWESRENASIDSALFRLSIADSVTRIDTWCIVGDRKIRSTEVGYTRLYFLRLPDGGYTGEGFERFGYQSLEKFRQDRQSIMVSVDSQNTYGSWAELANTLDDILCYELAALGEAVEGIEKWLSFPEPESELNPDDHNDHLNTTLLLRETQAYTLFHRRAFVHYHIRDYADPLSGPDLFWKTGMFSNYHQTVYKERGHSTLQEDPSFIPWCLLNSLFREL